jgi:tetratricopeptide (TPR) repeat protein
MSSEREHRRIPLGKRLLFHLVTVVVFLGLTELILALFGIRPVLVEQDPYVGFASQLRLYGTTSDGSSLRTASNKLALFNDQQFPRKKGADTFRVFTLGGSVTYGRPFDDSTSFSGWLRTYLDTLDDESNWEVINAGGISYASYRVAKLMEELVEYEPDLFIILSGHNEFLEKRTYAGLIEEPETLTRTKLLLQRSRLFALGRKIATRREKKAQTGYELTGEVEEILESSAGLDYYFRDEDFERQVLAHYRFNLQRMFDLARTAGARVILVSIPVNEKDFAPFKSQHRDGISEAERDRVALLLAGAAAALEGGESERARELAAEAVILDPLFADSHYLHGRALQSLGLYEEAAAAFALAVEEDVCPLRALAETNEIVFEIARRNRVPLVDFRRLLKQRMMEMAGHSNLGDEFFLDHAHPTVEANGTLARALTETLAETGLLQLAAGEGDGADQRVRKEVLARVDAEAQARAYKNLSKVLLWAGKNREAAKYVQLAAEVLDADWEVAYNAGAVQLEAGDYAAALQNLREAALLSPDSARAHDLLGVALAAVGRLQPAIEAGEKAIRLDPQLAGAWNNLGTLYSARGDHERALEATRQALRLAPDFAEAHNNLGKVHFDRGKLDEALASFERAMELRPSYLEAMQNRGLVLGELGRFQEATEAFSQALALEPKLAPAHLGRAKALLAQGDRPGAAAALTVAVGIDPNLVEAWELLVIGLVRGSQPEQALDLLEQGLTANPEAARLYHLRGRIHAQKGRWDSAADSFLRAVTLEPELLSAWVDLGKLRMAEGRATEAVRVYRQALALSEDDDRLHHVLALALLITEQLDEARVHLERSLEIKPTNAGAALDLATLHERLGHHEQALALYRRAARLDPQSTRALEGAARLGQ